MSAEHRALTSAPPSMAPPSMAPPSMAPTDVAEALGRLDGQSLVPAEGLEDEAPHALHPSTWVMLRALRAGRGLSRNRHFALFARPEIKKALQIHRFLNSVVADLERADGEVKVARLPRAASTRPGENTEAGHPSEMLRAAGTCGLRIELAHLHGRRTVYLSAWELALLAEQAPEVARRLDQLLADSQAEALALGLD